MRRLLPSPDQLCGTLVAAALVAVVLAFPPASLAATPASALITVIGPDPVANGSDTQTVQACLFDGSDTAITSGGDAVLFSFDRASAGATTDEGNGCYETTMTAGTLSGPVSVTVSDNGSDLPNAAGSTVPRILGDAAVAADSSVSAGPGFAQVGGQILQVVLTPRDANFNVADNPTEPDHNVSFTTTGGYFTTTDCSAGTGPSTITATEQKNIADGTDYGFAHTNYTAELCTPTNSGSGTISATMDVSAAGSTVVSFRPGPASTSTSTLTASPVSIPADGISQSLACVTTYDDWNNLVSTGSYTITMNTPNGSLGPVTYRGSGQYCATYTSSTIWGGTQITGTINGSAMMQFATITLTSVATASPTISTITASPTTTLTANGTDRTTVCANVTDNSGSVWIGAVTVTLSAQMGTIGPVTRTWPNHYCATYTAPTSAGLDHITGTLDGTAMTNRLSIFLNPVSSPSPSPSPSPQPGPTPDPTPAPTPTPSIVAQPEASGDLIDLKIANPPTNSRTIEWDWEDPTGDWHLIGNGPSATFEATCLPDGTYPVRVVITDNKNSATEYGSTVVVRHAIASNPTAPVLIVVGAWHGNTLTLNASQSYVPAQGERIACVHWQVALLNTDKTGPAVETNVLRIVVPKRPTRPIVVTVSVSTSTGALRKMTFTIAPWQSRVVSIDVPQQKVADGSRPQSSNLLINHLAHVDRPIARKIIALTQHLGNRKESVFAAAGKNSGLKFVPFWQSWRLATQVGQGKAHLGAIAHVSQRWQSGPRRWHLSFEIFSEARR
jgi:hypothetical protein